MEFLEVYNQRYHVQGFTSGNGYMYWSFTDTLVKTTMDGIVRRQTEVFGGHLGDCDYHDGKIYVSYTGNCLPGHEWGDWTAFKIYVFDADDLSLIEMLDLDICYGYKKIACSPEDTRGFRGIDGVAIAPDPKTGEDKMFVACTLCVDEKFSNQIILQFTLDGVYETEHYIPTGNTVFGIQNLDYDAENKEFWFTTYNAEPPHQDRATLYCIPHDLSGVSRSYLYATPFGLDCLGKDGFYASVHYGPRGRCGGIAYRCDESRFAVPKTMNDLVKEFKPEKQ